MDVPDLPVRTACGFVLVRRRKGRLEYLSLVNREREEAGLPKGHSLPGETEEETARRETEEETGLAKVDLRGDFRIQLAYPSMRRGARYDKRVTYFAAYAPKQRVRLSPEHSSYAWLSLAEMIEALPHESLRDVVEQAARFLKDPALCALDPRTEAEADAHLRSLPEASDALLGHLRGGAALARTFAEALEQAGVEVDVEAAAIGTLLHDVGRALGKHKDHQRAGVKHLVQTPFAAYSFACISHFTKGASGKELVQAGVKRKWVKRVRKLQDLQTETWEERCCALADACMQGATAVPPAERFADLRTRYDTYPLIALQEFKTAALRRRLAKALGLDPLTLVGLDR